LVSELSLSLTFPKESYSCKMTVELEYWKPRTRSMPDINSDPKPIDRKRLRMNRETGLEMRNTCMRLRKLDVTGVPKERANRLVESPMEPVVELPCKSPNLLQLLYWHLWMRGSGATECPSCHQAHKLTIKTSRPSRL